MLIAAIATCAGGLGLALTYAPDAPYVLTARDGARRDPARVRCRSCPRTWLPGHVIGWLTAAPWRFVLAPARSS